MIPAAGGGRDQFRRMQRDSNDGGRCFPDLVIIEMYIAEREAKKSGTHNPDGEESSDEEDEIASTSAQTPRPVGDGAPGGSPLAGTPPAEPPPAREPTARREEMREEIAD